MIKRIAAFLPVLLLCTISFAQAQEYKAPESAAFDPVASRYFISNFGSNDIIQVDSNGVKTCFTKDLANSLGMVIVDKTLYVVENRKNVRGFNITDGSPVMLVTIQEAVFLNDITADTQGNLYVTDSNTQNIYKIYPTTSKYTLFCDTGVKGPNGIVYDNFNNRLLVIHFIEKAPIQALSLTDSTVTTVLETGLNNLDGITLDSQGNVYISVWGSGSFAEGFPDKGIICKYDNYFTNPPEQFVLDMYGPADIFFNKYNNVLVIPSLLEDIVKWMPMDEK